MNPEYNIQDRIDRYLNNEMNESEKLEFETQLSEDADLVSALKAQKVANRIVIGEELLKLKAQMSRDLSTGNYSGGIQNNIRRYLLIGSGVIIIVAILYFLIKDQNEINSTTIVNEKITLTPMESSQSSEDSSTQHATKEVNSLKNLDNSFSSTQKQKTPIEKQTYTYKNSSCTDSIISFSCQARGTCIHKSDGAIEIDLTTIKISDSALLFSVNPNDDFHKEPVIADLKSGIYTIYVKDSKQCLHTLEVKVEVPVISCEHNPLKK